MSVNRLYTHTHTCPGFWSRNCGWRLMVHESSQLESFTLTMPPVTTPPDSGSRLQMLSM